MQTFKNDSVLEIQKTIINNADEVKNSRNDLRNWVKEVKGKEQKLNIENDTKNIKTQPIRSHIPRSEQILTVTQANLFHENKKILEAEEEQQKMKDKADILKDRGNIRAKLGEYEKAILEYTAAIEEYDRDPKFFTNRALCYLKLNRHIECIDDCNRAIELDKFNVKAYYRRMQANEMLCFNTQALKDCTTVLMIDSKNREAKESLERINQKLTKTGAVPKGYSTNQSNNVNEGPHFSSLRSNMIDILPANKLPNLRFKKQLKFISIMDVVGPKDGKNYENSNIQISDEAIEKLFNGECGPFEEVQKSVNIYDEKEEKRNIKVLKEKIMNNTSTLLTAIPSIKENKLLASPSSTAQFYCTWKELSAKQKYHYLNSIKITRLNKILGACFDSDTLTDLLSIFRMFYVQNEDKLYDTLLEICKHDRLKILSLMLSQEDKSALNDILNNIKSNTRKEDLNFIKELFNLN